MSHTEETVERAHAALSGVLGALCTVLVQRRGLTAARVAAWQASLRRAADILEELK